MAICKKGISFFAAAEVDGVLYFSAWLMNGLFKMDLATENVTYIGRIKEEKIEANLHRFAFYYRGCVYFIPSVGNYITRLCLSNLDIQAIPLPEGGYRGLLNKFCDIIYCDGALWMAPDVYGAILKLDLANDQIEKYGNWPCEFQHQNDEAMKFCAAVCISGNICMCPRESEFFVTFDLATKEMKRWDWKYPRMAFCRMLLHKNVLWFLPEKDYPCIVGYDLNKGEVFRVETNEQFEDGIYALHETAFTIKDDIVLAPYETNHWLIFNTKTHQINAMPLKRDFGRKEAAYPELQSFCVFSRGFFVTSGIHKFEACIETEGFVSYETSFTVDDEEWFRFWMDVVSAGGISYGEYNKRVLLFEEKEVGLDTYIRMIHCLEQKESEEEDRQSFGDLIYREICKSDG